MYKIEESWTVEVQQQHRFRIQVKEGMLADTITLFVDEKLVLTRKVGMFSLWGTMDFIVDGVTLTLKWKWKSTLVRTKPESILITRNDKILAKTANSTDSALEADIAVPGWAKIFMGACVLLPIVSLGGAIPVMAGIFGFMSVRNIATDTSRSTTMNVVYSALITMAMWAAVIFVAGGLALLTS